jgi:hypothetical protein
VAGPPMVPKRLNGENPLNREREGRLYGRGTCDMKGRRTLPVPQFKVAKLKTLITCTSCDEEGLQRAPAGCPPRDMPSRAPSSASPPR